MEKEKKKKVNQFLIRGSRLHGNSFTVTVGQLTN